MKNVFRYLVQNKISDANEVDKLIITAFLKHHQITNLKNKFIQSFVISTDDSKYQDLSEISAILLNENSPFDFENLIELFEFVVSPSDKVVNGAVYTPDNIRQYIVDSSLSNFNGDLMEVRAADISCGCGGFLLSLVQKLYTSTDKSFKDLFRENLYGIDIAEYSIQRTKILLSLFAIINGEDEDEFEFNLYTDNSLTFDWSDVCQEIKALGGFDIIVGNPPYVCSRNMDKVTLNLLQKWEVARTGHPDLYIPFFQIGLENLNAMGVLGYITVNTFIKSINGRALREYFAKNGIELTILNFGGEQIFQDRNTYTCICFLEYGEGKINYIRTLSDELERIDLTGLHQFNYEDLNHHDGWNLVNDVATVEFIDIIEKTGTQFKELYNTKNGIATLKNDIYKFTPIRVDDEFYYFKDGDLTHSIEVEICKNIVNANKIKTEDDIERLREQIIFPYDDQIQIISEAKMQRDFPNTYAYLQTKRDILASRDKGAREYETWYAYGRRQSMDIHAYKLFFPHICERPTFVICEDMDLLFYNGIAIVSDNLEELRIIKRVLESDMFFKYIRNTTKDYSSGYISMSRNYLKNFGVYQFNDEQKEILLNTDDVNGFIEGLYGLAY